MDLLTGIGAVVLVWIPLCFCWPTLARWTCVVFLAQADAITDWKNSLRQNFWRQARALRLTKEMK